MMLKKISSFLIIFSFVIGIDAYAQDVANSRYSPYSIFGVGTLYKQGSAYNKGMAYVGVASRNKRFLNTVNPASITARDTLAFLADIGMDLNLGLYNYANQNSAHNVFTVSNIAFSLPIYKKSAFYFGINPYSSVAYDFKYKYDNKEVVAQTGNLFIHARGRGSLYDVYSGIALTLWDKYSFGLQMSYYFGNIRKVANYSFQDPSVLGITSDYDMKLSAFVPKIAFQYERDFKKEYKVILGFTYKPSIKLKGEVIDRKTHNIDYKERMIKEVKNEDLPFLSNELALGLSVNKSDNLFLEFDYILADWRNTAMDKSLGFASRSDIVFSSNLYHSFRFGLEYTPNRKDIRYYYKRMSYRFGTYYNSSYFKVNDSDIYEMGLTFGVSLPIFRLYNGLSLAVDLQRRASLQKSFVKEHYVTLSVSFNINDIWFVKPKYE